MSGQKSSANTAGLIDTNSRFADATSSFGDLGPAATAYWKSFQDDPATKRFDALIAQALGVGLRGDVSPFTTNFAAFGAVFKDSLRYMSDLTALVSAASRICATSPPHSSRPRQIHSSPRSARQHSSPCRRSRPPCCSPTGRALQTTLDRLRESIRAAEERRGELEHVASHDGMSGLLNRAAAMEAIGRDLSRSLAPEEIWQGRGPGAGYAGRHTVERQADRFFGEEHQCWSPGLRRAESHEEGDGDFLGVLETRGTGPSPQIPGNRRTVRSARPTPGGISPRTGADMCAYLGCANAQDQADRATATGE